MKKELQNKDKGLGFLRHWKVMTMTLLLLTFSIGQMWGADQTLTVTNPATTKRYVKGNVCVTGELGSGTIKGKSSQASYRINSGSYAPFYAVSKAQNIKAIEFNGARNNNGALQNCFTLQTSADAISYSTPSSGFTIELDNNGTKTNPESLTNLQMVGKNQSYSTKMTITFDNPVMGVTLVPVGETFVDKVIVTYDDAILPTSELCEAHMTSTSAVSGTNCTATAVSIAAGATHTDLAATPNSFYYNKSSNTFMSITLPGEETFAEGDEIWLDMASSSRKKYDCYINKTNSTSGATTVQTPGTVCSGTTCYARYITEKDDPWVGQNTIYVIRGTSGSNTYLYQVTIHRAASCASNPAEPDELVASDVTGESATLTITDDNTPASYDIYYSKSATEPEASTPATATTTTKSKSLTGLDGSSNYYAWVRAVCDASHKSTWVALTGNYFTTLAAASKYDVTHTLSGNVKKTSGETGTEVATEGVNYDAVFAIENVGLGYSLPSTISVTIGGDPATVDEDYTWNATTGAFQVPAAKVAGDIVVTIAGTAPTKTTKSTYADFTQVGETNNYYTYLDLDNYVAYVIAGWMKYAGADDQRGSKKLTIDPATDETISGTNKTYAKIKQEASKYMEFYVTGITAVKFYFYNDGNDTRTINYKLNGGSETSLVSVTNKQCGSGSIALDASTNNTIRIYASNDVYACAMKVTVPDAYSVTYMPNGATTELEYLIDDEATEVADCPSQFGAPEGKAFAGWNTKAGGDGASYAPGDAVPSDLTLYAQWANKYTVTLMPAGGTCASYTGWTYDSENNKYTKEVATGTVLTLPTFTKDNRTFKTWRNAVPADVTSPITVTADVTLTAIWNATVETVIYSWEGAEGGAIEVGGTAVGSESGLVNTLSEGYYCLRMNGDESYSKYVEITLSGEEKVKTGDKIKYWGFYSNEDDKNAAPKMRDGNSPNAQIFADGTNLPKIYGGSGTPAQRTFTVPADINTNKVQMTRNKTGSSTMMPKIQIIREEQVEESELLTVTFVYHDGITANTTVEVASGQKVAKPADPTWAHHRFNEWQLGGSAYDFSSTVTGDITLDATWTQLYTISFANGGGSGDAPAAIADKAQGETFTVPANTFTAPEGKEFHKWNDGSADYFPEATYTVGTANVTLTAVWRTPAAHYAITYNKGAHGTGTIEAGDKTEDVPFTLSSERFTRDGYVQTGWAESDGGAQAYALGGSYTANAAIELFPVWTATYTYEAPFNSGSECSATAPAGWTFANAGTYGASDATAAYVCKFGNTCPAPDSISSDDFVAFAKSSSVYATYDLGITTTVAVVNGIFNVGSSSARTFTIDYLGSDGTTVKHTVTINHPASKNWGRNTVNEKAIVDNVRYIKIKGMASNMSWIIMQSFSVKYLETRTQYTVSFAAGDGSGSMDAKKYIADAVVKAPASTFTAPEGKEFEKWAVTGVGGVTEVEAGGTFTMPAGAVMLTAQWRIPTVKYTVAYYDGASKLGDEEVETGASPVDYADYQTKANYVFVGWYNDPDLAEEHKVTIASEVISDDANYYGKWVLDLQVTKIVFSNGFDAFINGNTVKAYYMAGESAPTMTSYEKNANVKDGGVAIVGNKVVLTGTDDSQKEYDLTLEAVTPMSSYDLQTFDGNETYVKTGNAYHSTRKWVFSKSVEEASNKRISEGKNRLYFFVGGSADKATFTSSADNRAITVYVNNVIVPSVTHTAANGSTFDIPLDPNDANNMIAIISNQTSGDGGVGDLKLNEHVVSTDVTLSSLTVNGNAVDLASGSMVAGVMTFNYELPYGTDDAPTVAAVANDAFASLGTITQAASTTGTATFTVTAEDASTLDYAVKFSVSLIPNIVIWDGSTMSAVKTSPDASGLSWASAGISPTSFSAKTCAENGKSYTKALDFGGKTSSSRQFSITVPENYFAKVTLVYRAKGTGNRSIMVSSALSDAVDENTITSVAAVDADNLYIMRADYGEGTLYINTTDGYHVHEISVQLYHVDYSRTMTAGRFGTICLPNGGVMIGAALFEVAYHDATLEKIFFDEILNGEMVAGRPYIFLPNEGVSALAVTYTDAADEAAGNYHGLYGSYTQQVLAQEAGNYILYNNQYMYVGASSSNVSVGANRAYFKIGVEGGIPTNAVAPLPGRRRVSMSAVRETPTGLENGELINGENGVQKVLINGELFILRGEKMYDATGRLVK